MPNAVLTMIINRVRVSCHWGKADVFPSMTKEKNMPCMR